MKLLVTLLLALVALCGVANARTLTTAPLPGGKTLPYFASTPPEPGAITHVLIAMHGYTRDATRTYHAAYRATHDSGQSAFTLIVAPIFPVAAAEATHCSFHGMPVAMPGNALWRCNAWSKGGLALNDPGVNSFTAMDRLVAILLHHYLHVRQVTIAGFSAGGQFVQRYAGFAAVPTRPVALRFVVADPSTFLYFDPVRPLPGKAACSSYNNWKLGMQDRPHDLAERSAATVRATYAAADIAYLEGALDSSAGRGTAYRFLAKRCGPELQGRYRLDRGENYAAYDRQYLAHGRHKLTVVPGCAHSVICVFESTAARKALFGDG